MTDIKQQVREYILDNFLMGASSHTIDDTTSFMESGILDSTGFIELITLLEERYGIEVLDEEMVPDNLDSLANIERFVKSKDREAASS